ncbi:hypothetical protein P4S68_15705 [Pseudoalteromonas sp. Hal099]
MLHQQQRNLADELASADAACTRSNAYSQAAATLEQYKTQAHQSSR